MRNSLLKTKKVLSQVLVPLTVFWLFFVLIPIEVFAQNRPPVAEDDSAITPKNTPVIIDVVCNDSDPEGALDLSSLTITTPPAHGEAVSHGGGIVIYTPNTDFVGSDSFVYQICDDGDPALCVTATVDVEVAIPVFFNVITKKLNVKKMGVLPVVAFGSADLDVATIDPASIRLEGIAPFSSQLVGASHGPKHLNLKFMVQEVVAAIGEVSDGDEVVLHLTGNLNEDSGGNAVIGEDTVFIIKKGKSKPPKK